MRVVAGVARGVRLVAPDGLDTRPTSDRVREAMFNALWSLGAVDDARVLDLYAGTGALGIEALSRGARSATFVESDRRAAESIEQNLTRTKLGAAATVRRESVDAGVPRLEGPFDLVLADPPYAFDDWPALLSAIESSLAADAVVVLESDRVPDLPEPWRIVRSKAYGGTVVVFVTLDGPDRDDATGAHP